MRCVNLQGTGYTIKSWFRIKGGQNEDYLYAIWHF